MYVIYTIFCGFTALAYEHIGPGLKHQWQICRIVAHMTYSSYGKMFKVPMEACHKKISKYLKAVSVATQLVCD